MLLPLLCLCLAVTARAADTYTGFAALAKANHEGTDYVVKSTSRGAAWTVMAIHGGWIEHGTDSLASEIAGTDLNLYEFIVQAEDANRLHITSTHFDEPRALALVSHSKNCLSLHGFLEREKSQICIGGMNSGAGTKLRDAIAGLGIQVLDPCVKFPGTEPGNIVNRCINHGVQLEISTRLRDKLQSDQGLRRRLVAAIRGAL